MTTRRDFLTLAGAGLASGLVLAGCDGPARPTALPSGGVPDQLFVDTASGLAILGGRTATPLGAAVTSPDGSWVFAAAPVGGGRTELRLLELPSGQVRQRVELAGSWVPRVSSPGGDLVALTPSATARGRDHSTVLVSDGRATRYRLELPGNYEPDAFGRDGTGLFVLDWLPPAAPDRYRVRIVDLATGQPGSLFTRDKVPVPPGAEEEMRGQGRQAVYAPDRQTLFTLYTNQPDHLHTRDLVAGQKMTEANAFVHTLNMQIGWAYCLDLPEPFGDGPAAGHTIAVTPDGRRLLVADHTSGRLAVADTETLTVSSVVPVQVGEGTAASVVSSDQMRLYLGIGAQIHVVDLSTLTEVAHWPAFGEVRGLALSADGQRLLVGYPDAVGWFDPVAGGQLGRVVVPGVTWLRGTVPAP
jgi:YVTN family beta-propeller protein